MQRKRTAANYLAILWMLLPLCWVCGFRADFALDESVSLQVSKILPDLLVVKLQFRCKVFVLHATHRINAGGECGRLHALSFLTNEGIRDNDVSWLIERTHYQTNLRKVRSPLSFP